MRVPRALARLILLLFRQISINPCLLAPLLNYNYRPRPRDFHDASQTLRFVWLPLLMVDCGAAKEKASSQPVKSSQLVRTLSRPPRRESKLRVTLRLALFNVWSRCPFHVRPWESLHIQLSEAKERFTLLCIHFAPRGATHTT
jgi:hypothetical protein